MSLAGQDPRRSERVAAAWRARYIRGECEADEMEAGVERALRGEVSDAEYVAMAREEEIGRLATVDAVLKSLYQGPIRSCR